MQFILKDSIKTLSITFLLYALLVLPSIVWGASCVTFQSTYIYDYQIYQYRTLQIPIFTNTNTPSTCALLSLTGSEYNTILSNQNTTNNNVLALQTQSQGMTASISQLNTKINNQQTQILSLNDNIVLVDQKVENLTEQFNDLTPLLPQNNPNNILNISHDDAQTLMYALIGLFAIAGVSRFMRKSLDVGDKYAPD